jgi:hypothetical protein
MIPKLVLLICSVAAGQAPGDDGTISGIVVNASEGRRPVGGAEVMLRMKLHGQLVPVAQTTADGQGWFVFRDLMVGGTYQYLPGANRQDIHYPGPRIQLTPQRPRAEVELAVHDAVTHPCPLVIRRHEITVRPEPGALHVTESILVDNPSSKSYVGQSEREGGEPVTLGLAVPPDFERLTFDKEFFGRRFSMVDGKLVTSIPWTPGQRELNFTYVLRNSREHRVWQRPLDLPCSRLSVSVQTSTPEEVRCNLQPGSVEQSGDLSTVTFQSDERTLPAGHVIRLELGKLPVPWTVYGKWLALLVLTVLIAGAGFVMIGQRRRTKHPSGPTDSVADRRRARRKRRRKAA